MLKAWKDRKWGVLSKHSYDVLNTDVHALAGRIKRAFGPGPDQVRISSIEDRNPTASSVSATLRWGAATDEVEVHLVYYKGDQPAPRNVDGGTWLVYSLWPLESARSIAVDGPESDDAA
jgi:hypothetical protein